MRWWPARSGMTTTPVGARHVAALLGVEAARQAVRRSRRGLRRLAAAARVAGRARADGAGVRGHALGRRRAAGLRRPPGRVGRRRAAPDRVYGPAGAAGAAPRLGRRQVQRGHGRASTADRRRHPQLLVALLAGTCCRPRRRRRCSSGRRETRCTPRSTCACWRTAGWSTGPPMRRSPNRYRASSRPAWTRCRPRRNSCCRTLRWLARWPGWARPGGWAAASGTGS